MIKQYQTNQGTQGKEDCDITNLYSNAFCTGYWYVELKGIVKETYYLQFSS